MVKNNTDGLTDWQDLPPRPHSPRCRKSIRLIGVSLAIWETVVTPIKFLGNGIVMAGLVYYNLGGEKVQDISANAKSRYSQLWQQRWTAMKGVLTVRLVMLGLGVLRGIAVSCGGRLNLGDLWKQGGNTMIVLDK